MIVRFLAARDVLSFGSTCRSFQHFVHIPAVLDHILDVTAAPFDDFLRDCPRRIAAAAVVRVCKGDRLRAAKLVAGLGMPLGWFRVITANSPSGHVGYMSSNDSDEALPCFRLTLFTGPQYRARTDRTGALSDVLTLQPITSSRAGIRCGLEVVAGKRGASAMRPQVYAETFVSRCGGLGSTAMQWEQIRIKSDGTTGSITLMVLQRLPAVGCPLVLARPLASPPQPSSCEAASPPNEDHMQLLQDLCGLWAGSYFSHGSEVVLVQVLLPSTCPQLFPRPPAEADAIACAAAAAAAEEADAASATAAAAAGPARGVAAGRLAGDAAATSAPLAMDALLEPTAAALALSAFAAADPYEAARALIPSTGLSADPRPVLLVGTKVVGDINVPSGQITFVAYLRCDLDEEHGGASESSVSSAAAAPVTQRVLEGAALRSALQESGAIQAWSAAAHDVVDVPPDELAGRTLLA
jgi:hypothetical protein